MLKWLIIAKEAADLFLKHFQGFFQPLVVLQDMLDIGGSGARPDGFTHALQLALHYLDLVLSSLRPAPSLLQLCVKTLQEQATFVWTTYFLMLKSCFPIRTVCTFSTPRKGKGSLMICRPIHCN